MDVVQRPRENALGRTNRGRKMSLLEVVPLTEADAEAAGTGGADRVEMVVDVQAGGLSPDPRMVAGMLLGRASAHAALVRQWRAPVDASPCPRAPADPE
ncbi:MAG: hypothetical protein JWR24_4428 [Actinoallomurus sp.]|jgi:hypothetical protein|nr:hypothetical protein [Actinoallomurus sp.]